MKEIYSDCYSDYTDALRESNTLTFFNADDVTADDVTDGETRNFKIVGPVRPTFYESGRMSFACLAFDCVDLDECILEHWTDDYYQEESFEECCSSFTKTTTFKILKQMGRVFLVKPAKRKASKTNLF